MVIFKLFIFCVVYSIDCIICFQIFEGSTKLQNLRLERQQQLQRKQLREWKEFAETYSSDRISLSSERTFCLEQSSEQTSLSSEQSVGNNVSMGMASL